jgi:hypothetical protein
MNAMNASLISETSSGEGSSNRQTINVVYDPLIALRDDLRAIWKEDDPETKEWRIFCLRGDPTTTLSSLATVRDGLANHVWERLLGTDVRLRQEASQSWLHSVCGQRRVNRRNSVSRPGIISGSEDRGRRDRRDAHRR